MVKAVRNRNLRGLLIFCIRTLPERPFPGPFAGLSALGTINHCLDALRSRDTAFSLDIAQDASRSRGWLTRL
jgi:hypothetical protein